MTKNNLIGVLCLYLLSTTERKASSMNHHKVVCICGYVSPGIHASSMEDTLVVDNIRVLDCVDKCVYIVGVNIIDV